MGDVISLRLKKKLKFREGASEKARENRVAFGRPKAEKKLTTLLKQQSEKTLDGHKREE